MSDDDKTPRSDAWFAYNKHNINYSACGAISSRGLIKFIEDAPYDKKEETLNRSTDAANLFEQLLFMNSVDNFNCYLSEIVFEIVKIDPRPIFGKKFDAKILFESDDIDEIKLSVIEKVIIEIGYQNIDYLTDYLEKNFGLKSLSGWLTKLRLNKILQIRNVISHNRGIANKTYMFRSRSKTDEIGSLVKHRFPPFTSRYLSSLVDKVDEEVVAKFQF